MEKITGAGLGKTKIEDYYDLAVAHDTLWRENQARLKERSGSSTNQNRGR